MSRSDFFRTLVASLGLIACGPALSAGFFCALKVASMEPEARKRAEALYPPIFVRRVDYAETATEAACRQLDGDLSADKRECSVPIPARLIQCLPAAPDPVVDPLPNKGGAGVEGAVGPKRAYRCLIHARPGSLYQQVHTWLEAGSWAEIDAVRVAAGARNDVNRGACLPAATYDQLFRLMGTEPPPSPFKANRPAAHSQAAPGSCSEGAAACHSGCAERERAGIGSALDAAVCRSGCDSQRRQCGPQNSAAVAESSAAPATAPAPEAAKPSRSQTLADQMAERLRRSLNRP